MSAEHVRDRFICLVLGTSEGGVGTHVRVLAARLTAAGATVVVCGPAATQELFDFAAAGANFVPLPVTQGVRPLADRRAVTLLRSVIGSADLVHAHGLRAGYVAVRAAPARTPVVVTWHNAVLGSGPRRRLLASIERRIAANATLNLAVSSDLVARIRAFGGVAELAPVGAMRPRALERTCEATRGELGAVGRPLVLSVGRLHPQKGFDLLVQAAASLAGRVPAPLFAIAGEGPARRALERAISRAGAPVRLLGRRGDVPELLAAADVVVMTSRWEGSPLAAHEALFAGRPVVAAAVGGLPDLGADGAVDLVRAGDVPVLAAAIARILDDHDHAARLAARGAARALTWPDGTASADAVIGRYDELLRATRLRA
jgi:glycosyltransferase involved in cell wall biosynthesis